MSKKSKKKQVVKIVEVVKTTKRKRNKRSRKRSNTSKGLGLSPAGMGFLKATTAPCDFVHGSMGFTGIPDEFDGNIIVDECTSISSMTSAMSGTTGNLDIYIVQAPIPGVAYMWGSVAAGSTGVTAITLTPVLYTEQATLFPSPGDTARVVDKFRVAANAIELVNVTNEMVWSGSIEAFKMNLSMDVTADSFVDVAVATAYLDVPFISGFDGMFTTRPAYVEAIKEGAFMTAFNQQASYPFEPIKVNTLLSEQSTNQNLGGASQSRSTTFATVGNNVFVGLGSLETNVIRIPAMAASQALRVRTWSAVEYTVPTTSILYNFSHLSPQMDLPALEYLKVMHHELPCAVTSAQNATFWEHVRKWVTRLTKVASYIPGAIGSVAGVVHAAVKSGEIGFDYDA